MPTFADISYTSADGRVTMYARDYGGAGMPVLCLHGLTRNAADFNAIADHLSGRYRIIVADQRGRGRSGWDSEPANYTPPVYVGDMFALLANLSLPRVVVLGTSMGGIMGMMMAAMAPQMIAGLVINDVGPVIDQQGLDRIASYTGKSPPIQSWSDAAARAKQTNEAAFPAYSDDDWLAFARRTYHEDASGLPVSSYDPAIAIAFATPTGPEGKPAPRRPDMWPLWDALTAVPVLSIRGAISDLFSEATMDEMARRHPGLKAAVVPGVGHAPTLDEPEAIAAIDEFLERIPKSVTHFLG